MAGLCGIAPHCNQFVRAFAVTKSELLSRNFWKQKQLLKFRCQSDVAVGSVAGKNVAEQCLLPHEHGVEQQVAEQWLDKIPEQDRKIFHEVERLRLQEQEQRTSFRRKAKFSPESVLRFNLDHCSKYADVVGALTTYEKTRKTIRFDQYNYNILLYLCSTAALGVLAPMKGSKNRGDSEESDDDLQQEAIKEGGVCLRGVMADLVGKNTMGLSPELMDMCLQKGLDIFQQMLVENVEPNEATLTALARFAVARRDGDSAFEIVKRMVAVNITPKLRCYGPALYIYFSQNNATKAFEVYKHMLEHDVQPEEAELEVLLELGVRTGWEDEVYAILHKLRETVRDVSQSTVNVIERWFRTEHARKSNGKYVTDSHEVKAAYKSKGGGWHGLGWLGSGDWYMTYTQVDKTGVCSCCKERLVTIDIDPQETQRFAARVSALATKREQGIAFDKFKEWLDNHGPYDWVIDGANVGMFNQGQMSFGQLNAVVSDIRKRTGRWPLVVLHHNRVTTGPAKTPQVQQLLRQWSTQNAIYSSPVGSNDDWYWLYAAVRSKALLVTNDEMRDHIFQLLGRSFFPKWKERHQIRFRADENWSPQFLMPPPYSTLIQESVKGWWHVPVSEGDDLSAPRKWLCVTRSAVQTLQEQ